jgi:hypothetical protein
MNNFDRVRRSRLRADLAKGLKQGLLSIKKGAIVVKKQADLSTEESKRSYKLIPIKLKVHQGISDLGASVYSLMRSRKRNPGLDSRIKDIAARVRRYETEIEFMEKNLKMTARMRLGKAT